MFDSLRSGNEDVVLSPIVVCQPSGLQLKRKCTLEIPHCAYQPNTFWVMDVKTCHGDLLTTCSYKWITVSTNSIAIEERKLLIDVNHFTLYACVGVTKAPSHAAKRMHLVSFLDATQTTHNTVKQRVYCLNDYSVDLKVAAEREITLGAPPKMSDSTQLLVYDTGKDVIVEVDSLNDQWRVLGSSSERLPYALVWEAYTPHCTLVFEGATVAGTKSEKLVCDILAYQDGNDNNVGKLKIAENVFGELPESIVRIQSQRNQVAETLKEMLDPINECATNAGDWQALAEKMGCSYVRIKWLETQIGSPTVVLIHQWFAEGRTLGELIQKLEEINRPDAVQELRNLKTQNDLDNQKLHLNENMQVVRRDMVQALRKKRPGMEEDIENDNVPAHRARYTELELDVLGIGRLERAPYSPDIAPLDFALFSAVKAQIRGIRFDDLESLRRHVQTIMSSFDK
ncbi:UN5CL-like protein [Mya arenaria]|uniref:UN5CL-like protein n=1 Tax=Mya arenaria TaxID=6604 RepID=A0ABY7G943_MYAAR|nr:UN5CL-like protein [Mya arenaria]